MRHIAFEISHNVSIPRLHLSDNVSNENYEFSNFGMLVFGQKSDITTVECFPKKKKKCSSAICICQNHHFA